MESALSASDVALLNNDGGFGGGNSFMWIFALLILFWGGNGMWGGNRSNGDTVTEATLSNAMNFNNLENTVGRISDTMQTNQMAMSRDMCTGFSAISNEIDQTRYDNLQNSMTTQRNIDGVSYNIAQSTAEINANTTAGIQKVLDAICGNRIADMQNQINALQLQNAVSGVVRYPNGMTYSAGMSPFCGCNSCC
jgi:hypothetical protein